MGFIWATILFIILVVILVVIIFCIIVQSKLMGAGYCCRKQPGRRFGNRLPYGPQSHQRLPRRQGALRRPIGADSQTRCRNFGEHRVPLGREVRQLTLGPRVKLQSTREKGSQTIWRHFGEATVPFKGKVLQLSSEPVVQRPSREQASQTICKYFGDDIVPFDRKGPMEHQPTREEVNIVPTGKDFQTDLEPERHHETGTTAKEGNQLNDEPEETEIFTFAEDQANAKAVGNQRRFAVTQHTQTDRQRPTDCSTTQTDLEPERHLETGKTEEEGSKLNDKREETEIFIFAEEQTYAKMNWNQCRFPVAQYTQTNRQRPTDFFSFSKDQGNVEQIYPKLYPVKGYTKTVLSEYRFPQIRFKPRLWSINEILNEQDDKDDEESDEEESDETESDDEESDEEELNEEDKDIEEIRV